MPIANSNRLNSLPTPKRVTPARATSSDATCQKCPIRQQSICATCGPDELKQLEVIKTYRSYPAGVEIVGAGETPAFVGSVVSGVVKLTRTMEDGRRQMVGLLFPSDFLGRSGSRQSECDAIAATDVTLCQFDRSPFERFLESTPNIERRLLDMTMDELDAARDWLLLLGRKTAREKVASFLVVLARRAPGVREADPTTNGRIRFQVPLSREDMADYLGLTIETVSRQMSALKKAGVISLLDARDVEVVSTDLLALEAGVDQF